MQKPSEFLKAQEGKEVTDSPSPLMNWLNPRIISVETGKLVFQYLIREEMTNPMGILHGGITAAIIDDAIGATVICYDEPVFHVTLNNVVDYFNAAKAGDVIIAETLVIKKGRQVVNVQCEVWNEGRTKMIARGYSNLLRTDRKRPGSE